MKELQEKIGARIRSYRNAKDYSIEEFAFLAGLNPVHLAAIERGEQNVTLSTLEKIISTLRISIQDVFNFEEIVSLEQPKDPLYEKILNLLDESTEDEKQFIYETLKFIKKSKLK